MEKSADYLVIYLFIWMDIFPIILTAISQKNTRSRK